MLALFAEVCYNKAKLKMLLCKERTNMTKRIIAAILLVAMVGCLLAACQEKKITTAEAIQIVKTDAGDGAAINSHVHEGEFGGKDCYYVYATVGDQELVYAVEISTGKILGKGPGSHSH